MSKLTNPSEIARETLKQLSTRRIVPTPDHYAEIYREIAGLAPGSDDPEEMLKSLRQDFPDSTPELAQAALEFKKAVDKKDWSTIGSLLSRSLKAMEPKAALPWASLLRELPRALETKHAGITTAKKKDGMETVLNNFGANPEILFVKLQSLLKSWSGGPLSQGELVSAVDAGGAQTPDLAATATAAPVAAAVGFEPAKPSQIEEGYLSKSLRELLAQTLYTSSTPLMDILPDLSREAVALSKMAQEATTVDTVEKLSKRLKEFWYRIEMSAGDDAELHEGLLRLLRLVIENISELMADDQWIRGQIAVVQEIISRPLSPAVLIDAERSMKSVIYKQSMLKHSLGEAKSSFKSLIANFIGKLSDFSESTSDYHHKIDHFSHKLTETDDISQINTILDEVMRETKNIQMNTLRSRDDVIKSQKKVEEANQRIIELESELENLSEMVREDQLTRTLNRRGLEDAFSREASRSGRKKTPLCVAILDIDNFKKLNDTFGHQAGDDALVHLSSVVKEIIRPNDVVARYGGEEFVIILPDSDLEHSIQIMQRVQRELTKNIFMTGNQKLVITFSAGVAMMEENEAQDSVIGRADAAMYQAKKSGKNRVIAAQAKAG